MLSRLVSLRTSVIWHIRPSTRWIHHSFGRHLGMPLSTQHILLDTHSKATVTSRANRAQSTAAAKVTTISLPNTTPKQREILILDKDLIFTNLRADYVDCRLAAVYAWLKIGDTGRATRIYKKLTGHYSDQKERLADVNIYNAFIEAYMKRGGRSKYWALHWLDEMRKQQIKPNLTTYAILIKEILRSGTTDKAHFLLMEMLKEGYNISAFMLNKNISNNELEMLNLIRKAKEGDYFEISSAQINKLLSSMGKPTTEVTETPVDLSSILETRPTNVLDVRLLKASLIPVEAKNMELYERQLHFEEQSVSASIERLRVMAEAQNTETSSNSYSLQSLIWSWHQKLYPMIAEEQQSARNPIGRTDILSYSQFILLLDAEKLSILTIQQLLRLSMDRDMENDISVTRAVSEIGNAIEMEYYTEQLRKRKNDLVKTRRLNLQALYSSGQLSDMRTRKIQSKLLEEEEEEGDWLAHWPELIRIKLGALLISMLLRVAKIKTTCYDKVTDKYVIEEIDAFYQIYTRKDKRLARVIRFNDKFLDLFSRDNIREILDPRMLPMLAMPRPWIHFESGGYMSRKLICMRIKDSPEQYHYLKEAFMRGHITKVLQGLDVLGSQSWTINQKVFNVVLEAWNSGGAYPSIPPLQELPVLPPKPPDYDTNAQTRKKWHTVSKEAKNEYHRHHLQRCHVNYKIEVARMFLGETIYFPHNIDFLGRAYPIPPLFNHLDDDICRGLLLFAEGKELGENGLRWLKIHLANLAGYDRHSFAEHIKFVEDNMENIYDSADNPLGGKQWWRRAEDPWQCLAACIELTEAMRSSDPLKYKSRLPVHQDGTCGGFHHYAALSSDAESAIQVNILPSDFPQDIYTAVCNLVNVVLEMEAEEGVEEAIALRGHITRKLIKQIVITNVYGSTIAWVHKKIVMTNVYGSTLLRPHKQIVDKLCEIPGIKRDKAQHYSSYLTYKVFDFLSQMFTGAYTFRGWLYETARRISESVHAQVLKLQSKPKKESKKDKNNLESTTKAEDEDDGETNNTHSEQDEIQLTTCVIWTTPLSLPIVQPCRRLHYRGIRTELQMIFFKDQRTEALIYPQTQRTTFPTNFMHSLDATHMIMSAIECKEHGLNFAVAHDSYWTHACDVNTMNKVLRGQFIKLHKQPLMESLRNEFIERYKDHMMPTSVLEEVNPVETELLDSESARLVDPLDLADDAENLLEDVVSDLEPDGVSLEDTMIQTEEPEPEPVKKMGGPRKEQWIPIEFPPLPPRSESDTTQIGKNRCFFY